VATLPGDVVRELVERHERELASLAADLDRARREADAVEARVRSHPALDLLAPLEVARLVPVVSGNGAAPGTTATAPRTTVVPRPRAPGPPAPRPTAGSGADPADPAADTRSVGSRLVTSHWVWKAGVALTAVALLLLKFG
jgi:hypothetical protein